MPGPLLTDFSPDPVRFRVIRECTESYDVGSLDAEWPNNVISNRAVVYRSGKIARRGDRVVHAVDPDELKRCQRIAVDAEVLMERTPVGMGSESGDGFQAFYIAANVGDPIPEVIDSTLIRDKFGGTLFPLVSVTVEPLAESTAWFSNVVEDLDGYEDTLREERLEPWRMMIQRFRESPELVTSSFVTIGNPQDFEGVRANEYPAGTVIPGSVFPRLVLGLTRAGSLAGLFGYCVKT